jgi:DNA-binding transcriptional MerR regulator
MAFYRIKEAAEKIGVVPHVLRFWETQFPFLRPSKTSRGQRLFSDEDLENFLRIKHLLYNDGYSIAGARKVLKETKAKSSTNPATSQSQAARTNGGLEDVVREELLTEVAAELKSLQEALKEF